MKWSPTIVNNTGDEFVKYFTSVFWRMTCCHCAFEERTAKLPGFAKRFADLGDYVSQKVSKPRLSRKNIYFLLDKMSSFAIQP